MMNLEFVRFVAHLLLIVMANMWIVSLWKLRNTTIKIVHVPLAIAGLCLFILWMLGLIVSLKDIGLVARSVLVPALAATELGAVSLGLVWTALCLPLNFQLKRRDTIVDPS